MKFQVTMKDPDVLHDAIREAAKNEADGIAGLDDDEREEIAESRAAKMGDICRRWFRYSEYLTVEIDTELLTATVIPTKNGDG